MIKWAMQRKYKKQFKGKDRKWIIENIQEDLRTLNEKKKVTNKLMAAITYLKATQ